MHIAIQLLLGVATLLAVVAVVFRRPERRADSSVAAQLRLGAPVRRLPAESGRAAGIG